jgi:DNA invertase Pin-like site-specific DNA recombinase
MARKAATKAAHTAVALYRVSTQRQDVSGLGLDGQRAAVEMFCRDNRYDLVESFTEVESGRKCDRPVLRKALARAKATKSLLVIGRLDRLARNVHFISGLMQAGIEFRACDVPTANRLTLHILAAVAEAEAEAISARTVAALAAAKARGTKLGASNPACHRLSRQHARKGAERTHTIAREQNREASAIAVELRSAGLSLPAIATELESRGLLTRTGRSWTATGILRLLRRAA